MASKRVGVDVGSTAVRAAEISMNGRGPILTRVAQVPLDPGAVENGELRDPAAVADRLKELWRVGRFSTRNVVLGIANHRVVVREVVLPWLEEKELRAALPFQVQQYVPIPVEEAQLDYEVVEEFEQEGRRMVRLLLVVAQKEMVQQLVETAEAARLAPVGLDLVPFAVMRSVGTLALFAEPATQDEAVIDVGGEVTSVCIHYNGLPRFVRILATGGADITAAIVNAAGVTREQARSIQFGRTPDAPVATLETARGAMSSRTAGLVDEIRSSLDFYESQSRGSTIGRVLVTGGGSLLDGFVESLNERVVPEVTRGHPYGRVSLPAAMQRPEMTQIEPLLAVAIGLAIPGGES